MPKCFRFFPWLKSNLFNNKLISEQRQLEADHFSSDLQQQRHVGHPRVQSLGGGHFQKVGIRKCEAQPQPGGHPAAKPAAGKQGQTE